MAFSFIHKSLKFFSERILNWSLRMTWMFVSSFLCPLDHTVWIIEMWWRLVLVYHSWAPEYLTSNCLSCLLPQITNFSSPTCLWPLFLFLYLHCLIEYFIYWEIYLKWKGCFYKNHVQCFEKNQELMLLHYMRG